MRALRLVSCSALLALAACTDAPSPATAPAARLGSGERSLLLYEYGSRRLAVDVELEPGSPAVAGLVTVGGPDMMWPVEAKLERGEGGELLGMIAVPPGEARWVALRVFDEGGEETHAGEGVFAVDRELTPQLELTLQPRSLEKGTAVAAFVGSYRVALSPRWISDLSGGRIEMQGRVYGPDGALVPMREGEVRWTPPTELGSFEWKLADGVAWGIFNPLDFGPIEWPKKVSPFELCYLALRYCRRTVLITPDWSPQPDWYVEVDGGAEQTCVRKYSGWTRCWGAGSYVTPAHLDPRRFATVSAGGVGGLVTHACAIDTQGITRCWGHNGYGELGIGGSVTWGSLSTMLLPVGGSHPPFAAVSSGGTHSCALTAAGEAYCWGDNGSAQLGVGTPATGAPPTHSTTPVPVAFGFIFSQVGAGARHACGLTKGGDVYCWGYGDDERLGSFNPWERCASNLAWHCALTPRPVAPAGVKFVALTVGGRVSCALTAAGVAYCWGNAALGAYNVTRSLTPVEVVHSGPHPFTAIAAAEANVCALDAAQQVLCWGENQNGEAGTGDLLPRVVPDTVNSTARYVAIGAGRNHFCAIVTGGARVDCWGTNAKGETGQPPSSTPVLSPARAPDW